MRDITLNFFLGSTKRNLTELDETDMYNMTVLATQKCGKHNTSRPSTVKDLFYTSYTRNGYNYASFSEGKTRRFFYLVTVSRSGAESWKTFHDDFLLRDIPSYLLLNNYVVFAELADLNLQKKRNLTNAYVTIEDIENCYMLAHLLKIVDHVESRPKQLEQDRKTYELNKLQGWFPPQQVTSDRDYVIMQKGLHTLQDVIQHFSAFMEKSFQLLTPLSYFHDDRIDIETLRADYNLRRSRD
jgi:hypothetical protein